MNTPGTTRHQSAWRRPVPWIVLLSAVAIGLAADLVSKSVAFRTLAPTPVVIERDAVLAKIRNGIPLNHREPIRELRIAGAPDELWRPILPPHQPTVVLPYALEFKLVLNAGAVFGTGQGKRWLFVSFTAVALGFCAYLFASWARPRDHLAHAAIGLIVSGGLGNLYDRLVFGCVRDFLHPLPNVQWPFGWSIFGSRDVWPYVSNVADAFLLIGIAIVMLKLWRSAGPPTTRDDQPDTEP
jgi:lipoprotein signal peptidase